jgi:PAS domain S-box-containing protein
MRAAIALTVVRRRDVVHSFSSIIVIDARGRIESINRSTERLLGYAATEVVGPAGVTGQARSAFDCPARRSRPECPSDEAGFQAEHHDGQRIERHGADDQPRCRLDSHFRSQC